MAAYIGAGAPEKALALATAVGVNDAKTNPESLSYELAYNTACSLIDVNDTNGAAKSLDLSRSTYASRTRLHGSIPFAYV
jgi:hypothetical protein